MKKILVLVLSLTPFVAQAELLSSTQYEISIDQTAYERVFNKCVESIKDVKADKNSNMEDAIEACDNAARRIAFRSAYSVSDGRYYITATPTKSESNK